MQKAGTHRDIIIHPVIGNPLCVVKIFTAMVTQAPTLYKLQPLLVFPDTYTPVSSPHLSSVWSEAISASGIDTQRHTLQCIRKTAATLAAHLGASEREIMDFGLWRSQAYLRYVHTNSTSSLQHRIASHIAQL